MWCRISGHSDGTCDEEEDCNCSTESVDRHFCSEEYDAEEQHTICAGWCQFRGQQTGKHLKIYTTSFYKKTNFRKKGQVFIKKDEFSLVFQLRGLIVYEVLLSWMPRFLANSFLGLNYVFSVQVWYICLNLIDLRKISTFCLFNTEVKAKKLLARNWGIKLRMAINIRPSL